MPGLEVLTYRVFWSDEDREYVGLCNELPGLSWLASTEAAALRGIKRVAREAREWLESEDDGDQSSRSR
jgi:predicted RNase H-like HicB family nuclease